MEISCYKSLGYDTLDLENKIREEYNLPSTTKVSCINKLNPIILITISLNRNI